MDDLTLRITTVQSALHWEDRGANLAMFSEKLAELAGRTDLVVLPEMFTTGFSMNAPSLAEPMDGPTMQWLDAQAKAVGAVITGSFIVVEHGRYYNRLVWMRPNGYFETYDKRHCFTLAGEHETYTAGNTKRIVELNGWKICLLICYDLRFPVWSRNTDGYDLLVFVANWPETRSHHWSQLLIARAIENQAYAIGVNRTGTDAKGHTYSGDTAVIDYSGRTQYRVSGTEAVFTVNLSLEGLRAYREKLPFLADRDNFKIFDR